MTKETQHVSEDATPPAQPAMDLHYMKQQQYKLHFTPARSTHGSALWDQGTVPTLFPDLVHSTASKANRRQPHRKGANTRKRAETP